MNIIIVGQDKTTVSTLREIVDHLGCKTSGVFRYGLRNVSLLNKVKIDLALVDIETPGEISGVDSVLKLRRAFGIPSILITSHQAQRLIRASLPAQPLGLIIKPVQKSHVELHIGAVRQFQKTFKTATREKLSNIIRLDSNIYFNRTTKSLFFNGSPLDLTSSELKLFELCLQRQGNIVPYETVTEHVWKGKIVAESTRRGLYHRLRKKLGDRLFETVNGVGCRVRITHND